MNQLTSYIVGILCTLLGAGAGLAAIWLTGRNRILKYALEQAQQQTAAIYSEALKLSSEKRHVDEQYSGLKRYIEEILKRPVYATLSDEQLIHLTNSIVEYVSAATKPPEKTN